MAKNENSKERVFKLIEILMRFTDEEHPKTLPEIISILSDHGVVAERKTLYSDFAFLEKIGIPVLKKRDSTTRYYVESRLFELAELKMLVDAVQSSKFITAEKSREIISKLEIFLSVYSSNELSRQIYVEDRIKTLTDSSMEVIDTVHNAINSKLKLSFRYFEYDVDKKKKLRRNGEKYIVTPLSLMLSEGNYYLVAYEEGSDLIKHFRVDKILDSVVISEKASSATKCEKFNPGDYSQKVFSMYGGREELVTIECREKLAGVMIDRFGTAPVFHKTDFGFKFTLRLMVSPTFFAWVMGFGKDVRILSPVSVRDELRDIILSTLMLYDKQD